MNNQSAQHGAMLEQIAIYNALTPEEQRAVVQYMREHSELAARLQAYAQMDGDLRGLANHKAEHAAYKYADRLAQIRSAIHAKHAGVTVRPHWLRAFAQPRSAAQMAGVAALCALCMLLIAALAGTQPLAQRLVQAATPTPVQATPASEIAATDTETVRKGQKQNL